jgi:hypothetical protein
MAGEGHLIRLPMPLSAEELALRQWVACDECGRVAVRVVA